MATLSDKYPTMLDIAKRTDPNGGIAEIVELLTESKPLLEHLSVREGNLTTGHKTTIRTGLPTPTWRKFYGGVQPTKSRTAQITDTCGSMEAYSYIDKKLAMLEGNTSAVRGSEDAAHIEGMAQEMATTLFYGNEAENPEKFQGLAPRYSDLSAENGISNIIDGAGTGSDNRSIWLIVSGPDTVFGITPKGLPTGIQHQDLGEDTIDAPDGGGKMQAYGSHFSWDMGLVVKDWRYVVRIANIDNSLLTADISTGADLALEMTKALERVPNLGKGRAAFYMSRGLREMLRLQVRNSTKNSTLSEETIAGRPQTKFGGIPVEIETALDVDEARVV